MCWPTAKETNNIEDMLSTKRRIIDTVSRAEWIKNAVGKQMPNADSKFSVKGRSLIFWEIPIFEAEVALLALAPWAFPVKIHIYSLLILFRDCLRFWVTLEPCQIFHVEAPWLTLQFLRSEESKIFWERSIFNIWKCAHCWYVPGR